MTVAFDTNVLIYAIDTAAGSRHASAGVLIQRALYGRNTVLILQAMTEFYSVATRKFGIQPHGVIRFLDELRAVLAVSAADERDFDRATKGDQHGLSFWDAMLWATADRIGVRWLLSEDFQDGRLLGNVRFVNPFSAGNEALLARVLPPV